VHVRAGFAGREGIRGVMLPRDIISHRVAEFKPGLGWMTIILVTDERC